MTILIVNLAGITAIAFIVWWFWLSGTRSVARTDGSVITVIVDSGVYEPSQIKTVMGRPVTLRFIRKDPSVCAEKVIFNDWEINADLPLDKPYDLTFTPDKPGVFEFTCQMAMYRGKLIVESEGLLRVIPIHIDEKVG